MGLLKKFKRENNGKSHLKAHPVGPLKLEDDSYAESYGNFNIHEKNSLVYGQYLRRNQQISVSKEMENNFFRNKMKIEPVNKENLNENMKESIVKSRTKFCKKQRPISLNESLENLG